MGGAAAAEAGRRAAAAASGGRAAATRADGRAAARPGRACAGWRRSGGDPLAAAAWAGGKEAGAAYLAAASVGAATKADPRPAPGGRWSGGGSCGGACIRAGAGPSPAARSRCRACTARSGRCSAIGRPLGGAGLATAEGATLPNLRRSNSRYDGASGICAPAVGALPVVVAAAEVGPKIARRRRNRILLAGVLPCRSRRGGPRSKGQQCGSSRPVHTGAAHRRA